MSYLNLDNLRFEEDLNNRKEFIENTYENNRKEFIENKDKLDLLIKKNNKLELTNYQQFVTHFINPNTKFEILTEEAIKPFVKAAEHAVKCGLGINAGHDLNLENLNYFAKHINSLIEVSIGHALISDALYFGLENTIQLYKRQLHV